ncbi:hypothetical protein [Candidatus Uabimicrobium sp. HlEnr_7]|uniref:hypothetical protein n=1 Tax=Candidatus Uabimicrobium helgolandensis TaxID=3095367 RepID=UPI0035587C90
MSHYNRQINSKHQRLNKKIAPAGKSIPQLIEDAISSKEHLSIQIYKANTEVQVEYQPNARGGKDDLSIRIKN